MPVVLTVLVASLALGAWPADGRIAQAQIPPRFRTAVDRVTVAATVRDRRGRPVTTLTAADFTLLENGRPRQILDFTRDAAPLNLAILTDLSGSMDVGGKHAAAVGMARELLGQLAPGTDRTGLYVFDRQLDEVAPFGSAPADVLAKLAALDPWGRTSLFDAIAGTGRRLAAEPGARRAVVVLTDGYDNASVMTPGEVSGLASGIDVPVYVIVVSSPLDRAGASSVIAPLLTALHDGPLGNLARWTGGEILLPMTEADIVGAARQIVTELRHQYLMAFEPTRQPGWYPLEVRTRRSNLVVRARSGYLVPAGHGDRH